MARTTVPNFRTSFFQRDITTGKMLLDSTGQPIINQLWQEFILQSFRDHQLGGDLEVLQAFDPEPRGDLEGKISDAIKVSSERQRIQPAETDFKERQRSDRRRLDDYGLLAEMGLLPRPERTDRAFELFPERHNLPSQPRYLSGTRAVRANVGAWPARSQYYETDTDLTYEAKDGTWHYLSGVWIDTYGNRPAATALGIADDGLLYKATVLGYTWKLIYSGGGNIWEYVSGVLEDKLADIPDLSGEEVGPLFWATDYKHLYRWSGTAWEFAPGDSGSAFVVVGQPDGAAPNGGLWAVCDGNAVDVAQSDGTVDNITTQNLQGDVFITGAAATASQQAAAAPTGSATKFTVDAGGTNALTAVNAPSEADGGLPLRIAVVFYIRR
jgi:hypothetical protein